MAHYSYIHGLRLSVARKIARFVFGDDVLKVLQNNKEHCFDLYLHPEADGDNLNTFIDFWGETYRVFQTEDRPFRIPSQTMMNRKGVKENKA